MSDENLYIFNFMISNPIFEIGTCSIDLGDLSEIRVGHQTDPFNKLSKKSQKDIDGVNCDQDLCFSIVFKDDTPPLDLIAEKISDRNTIVNALTHLVATIKSLGQQYEFTM